MNIRDKIIQHADQADSGWGPAYPLFSKVIRDKHLLVGAEIGVAFGGHAEYILKHSSVDLLYGIDPYQHFEHYDDPMNLPQHEFDALCAFTLNRLSPFKSRFRLLRNISAHAAKDIVNELDFVYIDALHTYQGVWNDLCVWYSKVRYGGIIGGHDYGHVNFPGVKQAIDEFFSRFNWTINEEGEGVWWVEKRKMHISFIMPAYNCEGTVQESIESIFDGNFKNGDEIIIVNDASQDKTLEIVNGLQKKYSAIKVISHNINKGSAAAGRNTGIDNSENNLIFCLDADNILAPKTIPILKEFMLKNNADAAAFGELHYFKINNKEITHKWIFKNNQIKLNDALAGYYWPGSSGNYLFTKESWKKAGRYDETLGGSYDSWAFGIKQLATNSKMIILKDYFYYHRYGYQSTFVRDQYKMRPSLIGLSVLIKFFDLIKEEDIDYIMSKHHRYSWFENIEKRPIRLKDNSTGTNGWVIDCPPKNKPAKEANYKKYLQPKKYLDFIKRKISGYAQ